MQVTMRIMGIIIYIPLKLHNEDGDNFDPLFKCCKP